jgi:hypothetical protein
VLSAALHLLSTILPLTYKHHNDISKHNSTYSRDNTYTRTELKASTVASIVEASLSILRNDSLLHINNNDSNQQFEVQLEVQQHALLLLVNLLNYRALTAHDATAAVHCAIRRILTNSKNVTENVTKDVTKTVSSETVIGAAVQVLSSALHHNDSYSHSSVLVVALQSIGSKQVSTGLFSRTYVTADYEYYDG